MRSLIPHLATLGQPNDLPAWLAHLLAHEWRAWGHELVGSSLTIALWEGWKRRRPVGAGSGPGGP